MWEGNPMTKFKKIFLAALVGAVFVAAPMAASARHGDGGASSGVCRSGKHVKNIKKCKEHGGKW